MEKKGVKVKNSISDLSSLMPSGRTASVKVKYGGCELDINMKSPTRRDGVTSPCCRRKGHMSICTFQSRLSSAVFQHWVQASRAMVPDSVTHYLTDGKPSSAASGSLEYVHKHRHLLERWHCDSVFPLGKHLSEMRAGLRAEGRGQAYFPSPAFQPCG